MKVKLKPIFSAVATNDKQCILYIEVPVGFKENAEKIEDKIMSFIGKEMSISVTQWREKRTLDANAYAWLLMDKLAKCLNTTKELIYIEIIKQVGSFEIVPIKNEAVSEWIRKWNDKGLGWHSEILSESKIEGYTNTINYFGSSVYNSKEMWVLINEIVEQCKEQGIETMTPDELAKLEGLCEEIEKSEGSKYHKKSQGQSLGA